MINAKLLISFALFIISYSVFAKPTNDFYKNSKGDNYIVSYSEEGKWILDHFLIEPGKLQEKISTKSFDIKNELTSYKNQKFGNFLKRKSRPNKRRYVTTEANNKIWKVKNQWDLNWEKKFAKWLEAEFQKDFFQRYNLETDCADVAFALRWIFARNNHLPAANTLAGSHMIFSQDSFKSEWSNLKRDTLWHKDEVFMAAVRYLMLHAFTGTLNIDTYPVEISKKGFLIGTIHLTGGHTMIISKVDYNATVTAPIIKLSSTVPAAVRELMEEPMMDQSNVDMSSGGLVRLRWPKLVSGKWSLIAKKDMPLYSEEQYSSDFLGKDNHLTFAIINKLGIKFNPKKVLEDTANFIIAGLKQRVSIVEDAYNACLNLDCSEGTFEYEEYSTPTRDGRLANKFKEMEDLNSQMIAFDSKLKNFWSDFKKNNTFTVQGFTKSLEKYESIFKYKFASYHPEDSLSQRWGLTADDKINVLANRYNRYSIKRKELVNDAKSCVGNSNCKRGTPDWEKFNTYEFDLKLSQEVYQSYVILCSKIDCTNQFDNSLVNKIENIAFLISEPYEASRNGEQAQTIISYSIPKADKIIQIDHEHFLLDTKVYNFKNRVFDQDFNNATKTEYIKEDKVLVSVIGDKVLYKTINGSMQKVSLGFKPKTLKNLSDKYIFITNYDGGSTSNQLNSAIILSFNPSSKLMEVKESFSNIESLFYNSDYPPESSVTLMTQTNNNTIEPSTVITSSSNYNIVDLQNTNYISSTPVGDYYFYRDSSPYFKMIHTHTGQICSTPFTSYINTMDSNSMFLANDSNSQINTIFKINGLCDFTEIKKVRSNEWARATEVGNSTYINISQDLYILENDKLIKLKGRKDYVSSISSASEVIWLKFTPDYFKVTKAYILNTKTGAEVAQDPNYIKMKCGKNSSNGCKAIDKDAYVLMNYTKNIETTKIYGTMYLDNKILLSKYSVNSNSSEGYIRSRNISWNTGILAEIDDVFLYIP